MTDRSAPLAQLIDVKKHYSVRGSFLSRRRTLRAVDGVSLSIASGETLSIVGESGCGKSTLARLTLDLISPTSGRVLFEGRDLASLGRESLRRLRSRMQIVFQDPWSSLDPRMRIADIIGEPLRAHGAVSSRAEADAEAAALLEMVGLSADALRRWPHEFSGGQRQRIGIARAIALRPSLVVCDEPLSALDLSIRAQVINLLVRLKRELSLTYLFISHDLSVVSYLSDRIAVMYLGRVVELGSAEDVLSSPLHPYTRALIASAPIADPRMRGRARAQLDGEIPSAIDPPSGCRFRTRCPHADAICADQEPPAPTEDVHSASCHLATRGAQ